MLTEIDACLTTVAQTIEFGLTGGKNMSPSEYKPASQRVYDAAELLLSTLFSVVVSLCEMEIWLRAVL